MIAITLPSSSTAMLVKLLGLLGSDHSGERASAGLKAHQLLRSHGLTWGDVIQTPSQPSTPELLPSDWRVMREFLLQRPYMLGDRELDFIEDLMGWRGRLTQRQQKWLVAIFTRVKSETS